MTHNAEILDQFTRQAQTFLSVPARTSEESLCVLEEALNIAKTDELLDAACGPGIVATWLARAAKHVTGTDLVPAMIERARIRERELGLNNIEWTLADIYELPFPQDTFSVVVTRYSFHHLVEPERALREMSRVCRTGGRIAVVDVTPEEGKSEAYDRLEKLRDPSHVHALPLTELLALAGDNMLELITVRPYSLEISLDAQLAASFPEPGNAEISRETVRQDIGVNQLSVNAFEMGDQIILQLPVSIAVWTKR